MMKILKTKIVLGIICALIAQSFTISALSQGISLRAGVDSTHILLGDQIKLKFEITQPKDIVIKFPEFNDTIIDKVEIVEAYQKDTTWITNQEIKILQEYLITSFDSGFYYFPPFEFPMKGAYIDDTMRSNPFYMQVFFMQLDTANAIFPIKENYGAPVTFVEVLQKSFIYILIVIVILVIIYIIVKLKKDEPVFKRVKPKIPPHIVAFDELDKLKEEKLWQQGKIKDYYSRLTDIVRIYIEDRFLLRAMEQTTDETIESFKSINFNDTEALDELQDLLVQADFVKFAKANPLPDENEKSFNHAYNFVRRTKPISEIQHSETVVAQPEDNQPRLESSIDKREEVSNE